MSQNAKSFFGGNNMVHAVNTHFRPNFTEGAGLATCTQMLRDLVNRIQELFLSILQTILPCVFKKSSTPIESQKVNQILPQVAPQLQPQNQPAQRVVDLQPVLAPPQQQQPVPPPMIEVLQPLGQQQLGQLPVVDEVDEGVDLEADLDDDDQVEFQADPVGGDPWIPLHEEHQPQPDGPEDPFGLPENFFDGNWGGQQLDAGAEVFHQAHQQQGGAAAANHLQLPVGFLDGHAPQPIAAAAFQGGDRDPFPFIFDINHQRPAQQQVNGGDVLDLFGDDDDDIPQLVDLNGDPQQQQVSPHVRANLAKLEEMHQRRLQQRPVADVDGSDDEEDDVKANDVSFAEVMQAMRGFPEKEREEMLQQMFPDQAARTPKRAPGTFSPKTPKPNIQITGTQSLKQGDVTTGIFVCLEGLDRLWSKISESRAVTPDDLDTVLTRGSAVFADIEHEFSADKPIPIEGLVGSYDHFRIVELTVGQRFSKPRYPTLRYQTLPKNLDAEQLAKMAEDSQRVPERNTYRERIEDVAYALQLTAKNVPLLGALLFKGTQENPRTYGVFVHFNNVYRRHEFYLLDPYSTPISLQKFNSAETFRNYFIHIAPAPLYAQKENNYWVMPLAINELAADDEEDVDGNGVHIEAADDDGDEDALARLTAAAAAHALKPQDADADADDEDETQTF